MGGHQTKRDTVSTRPGSEDQSNKSSEPKFLLVGEIIRPHGIRGDLAMKIMTDHPNHLLSLKTVYLGSDHQPYQIKLIRRHKTGMLLRLKGISDRDKAETLRKLRVYIHIADAVPLEDGQYFLYQLEGIQVITDTGQTLGRFTDYIETGANDVYIISSDTGEQILLPAIPDVIKHIDLDAGIMTVHLLEGLL